MQASPMQLKYSTDWQQYLTQDVVDEMVSVLAYSQSCMHYQLVGCTFYKL